MRINPIANRSQLCTFNYYSIVGDLLASRWRMREQKHQRRHHQSLKSSHGCFLKSSSPLHSRFDRSVFRNKTAETELFSWFFYISRRPAPSPLTDQELIPLFFDSLVLVVGTKKTSSLGDSSAQLENKNFSKESSSWGELGESESEIPQSQKFLRTHLHKSLWLIFFWSDLRSRSAAIPAGGNKKESDLKAKLISSMVSLRTRVIRLEFNLSMFYKLFRVVWIIWTFSQSKAMNCLDKLITRLCSRFYETFLMRIEFAEVTK